MVATESEYKRYELEIDRLPSTHKKEIYMYSLSQRKPDTLAKLKL